MTNTHDELLLNGRPKTARQERKCKNSIFQVAVAATGSQKRDAKEQTTTKDARIDNMRLHT
jgi:hypothetical protein